MKIVDDLKALKPQGFAGVPRIFQRIYEKINSELTQLKGIKKWICDKALTAKKINL